MKNISDADGTEIDMDNVQITDESYFVRAFELELGATDQALRDGLAIPDALTLTKAWVLKDGSLLIRRTDQTGKELVVPSGLWNVTDGPEASRNLH